ncbi:TetR/AcrR family transcriptional regulator [Streptomyces albidochromogenes]|uniref:TetR/AcrR family transcriptional regulator n=1 Tax=Streptomyces albidochromogenes TaxID=329524 RepID=UPI00110F9533|nr:TetR/AcrR family transcriptional regulator [Streptomyces albidochromogenes]
MGQKGEETRGKLLNATQRLIEAGGYYNAGLNQVVAASGAPKGSLYFHFPDGKDQLIEEAVRQGGQEISALLTGLHQDFEEGGTADMLAALLKVLGDRLEASGWRQGCPVTTVALEMAAGNTALQRACSEVYASWEGALADRFEADGHPSPQSAATAVLALIEGALVLARAHRSRTPLDRAAHALAQLV